MSCFSRFRLLLLLKNLYNSKALVPKSVIQDKHFSILPRYSMSFLCGLCSQSTFANQPTCSLGRDCFRVLPPPSLPPPPFQQSLRPVAAFGADIEDTRLVIGRLHRLLETPGRLWACTSSGSMQFNLHSSHGFHSRIFSTIFHSTFVCKFFRKF